MFFKSEHGFGKGFFRFTFYFLPLQFFFCWYSHIFTCLQLSVCLMLVVMELVYLSCAASKEHGKCRYTKSKKFSFHRNITIVFSCYTSWYTYVRWIHYADETWWRIRVPRIMWNTFLPQMELVSFPRAIRNQVNKNYCCGFYSSHQIH